MVSTPTRNRAANSGGRVPQNYSDAGSPSPQHAYVRRPNRAYTASVFAKHSRDQRRQSLRETSTQDRTGLHAEYGPIGASSSRHSNTMSEHVGDPVHFNGRSSDNAEGYGSSASWSDAQGHRGRSHSTPEHPGVSNVSAGFASSPGVQAFLAGPSNILITTERELPNPDPDRPAFLHGIEPNPLNPDEWNTIVLPHVRTLTFIMSSTADLHYASDILVSNHLPYVYHYITKLVFPQLYWFSGVAHNRRHNPYFQLACSLPSLAELTFTMHTAGITTSCFGERQMIQLETTDPVHAKERKVMRVQDVVHKYDLGGLFFCGHLQRVRIEYIECEMTGFFTKVGTPVDVLKEVQAFLINEFAQNGQNVFVELAKAN